MKRFLLLTLFSIVCLAGFAEDTIPVGETFRKFEIARPQQARSVYSPLIPIRKGEKFTIRYQVFRENSRISWREIAKAVGIGTAVYVLQPEAGRNSKTGARASNSNSWVMPVGVTAGIAAAGIAKSGWRRKTQLKNVFYDQDTVFASAGVEKFTVRPGRTRAFDVSGTATADGFLQVVAQQGRAISIHQLTIDITSEQPAFKGSIAHSMNLQTYGECLPEYECSICDPSSGCFDFCACYPSACAPDPCEINPYVCECNPAFCPEEYPDPEPNYCETDPFNCYCDISYCPGETGPEDPATPEQLQQLRNLTNTSTLTTAQKHALAKQLDAFKNSNPKNAMIINLLLQFGAKFNFSINPNAVGNATFDPRNMNLQFRSEGDIASEQFGHELFHALQNELMPGVMPDILNDPTRTGFSNLEFETRIYHDLINFNSGFGSLTGDTNGDYLVFLQNILDNGMDCNFDATEMALYNTLLGYFKNTVPDYNKPSAPNMQPVTLQKLFGCP